MSLFDLLSPRVAKPKPIGWRLSWGVDDEWIGYIGADAFLGTQLFKINRENFVETGETFCLHSQLNADCVACYPTLQLAQQRAQEQWAALVKAGVTV